MPAALVVVDMTNQTILTMDVYVTNFDTVILNIRELILFDSGSYVFVSNVHMYMEVLDSIDFAKIVNGADLVVAD
jgi:N-acetylglucosaminyldiphosphoundecaprenol N-acetyl-beta-D-mannosaminyltransferase